MELQTQISVLPASTKHQPLQDAGLYDNISSNNNNNISNDKLFTSANGQKSQDYVEENSLSELNLDKVFDSSDLLPPRTPSSPSSPSSSANICSSKSSSAVPNVLSDEIAAESPSHPMCSEASSTCSPSSAADVDFFPAMFTSSYNLASFVSASALSPMKTSPGSLLAAVRCPPVREAVDPAKYYTISGEPDGVKYGCSKCGNVYKWRKSLNKHWKEKHDGEMPDPIAAHWSQSSADSRPFPSPALTSSAHCSPPFSTVSPSSHSKSAPRSSFGYSTPSSLYDKFNLVKVSSSSATPMPNRRVTSNGLIQIPTEPKLKVPTFDPVARKQKVEDRNIAAVSRPVDLSGSLPYSSVGNADSEVLDLSAKKTTPTVSSVSSAKSTFQMPGFVQDEPLDFSTKVTPSSSQHQFSVSTDPLQEAAQFFRRAIGDLDIPRSSTLQSKLEPAHRGVDRGCEVTCAQCHAKFASATKLNQHFTQDHVASLLVACSMANPLASGAAGSAQLLHYLTSASSTPRESMSCVVCGTSFQFRWEASRHFDQEHAGINPNPYRALDIATPTITGISPDLEALMKRQLTPPSTVLMSSIPPGNVFTCQRCVFTTDSFHVFARHQLRHSPCRPAADQAAAVMPPFWAANSGSLGVGEIGVDLLAGEDEHTAIVIPQAPEDTAKQAVSAGASLKPNVTSSLQQKPAAPNQSSFLGKSFSGSGGGGSKSSRIRKELVAAGAGASAEALLPFKCELCEYRARWPSEMTQHAKNHSDEKPFHCPQCSYRSKWKWDVVKHLKRCGGGGTARDVIDTTQQTSTSPLTSANSAAVVCGSNKRRRLNATRLVTADSSLVQSAVGANSPDTPTASASEFDRERTALAAQSLASLSSSMPTREVLSNGPPNVTVMPTKLVKTSADDGAVKSVDSMEVDHSASSKAVLAEDKNDSVATSVQNATIKLPAPAPPVLSLVNQGLHYCLQCPFVGHSPAELRRHLRVHSDEKPYTCRSCCYSSKWKCDLKKHLRAYNHVSGIPLSGVGNGRKAGGQDFEGSRPGSNGSESPSDGTVSDDDVPSPAAGAQQRRSLDHDTGRRYRTENSLGKLRRPANGGIAGVTAGGRLRCRRCDFEAFDITSFLQHKSVHSSSGPTAGADQKDCSLSVEDTMIQVMNLPSIAIQPLSHRRKSVRQTRVLPESKDIAARTPVDDANDSSTEAAGSKFWESLELRRLDESVENGSLMTMTDCLAGETPTLGKTETPVSAEEGVFQSAQAEDLSNVSKRKRKLRTCDKCAYITDNLTTLQRHAAKHGSTGRHRCTECDYTVDRQHILDYHFRNVHLNTTTGSPFPVAPTPQESEEEGSLEGPPDTDAVLTGAERLSSGKSETSPPKMSPVNRSRAQRCAKCRYSSLSVAGMSRHRLAHVRWSLPYPCSECSHRSTARRLLASHCARVHSGQS